MRRYSNGGRRDESWHGRGGDSRAPSSSSRRYENCKSSLRTSYDGFRGSPQARFQHGDDNSNGRWNNQGRSGSGNKRDRYNKHDRIGYNHDRARDGERPWKIRRGRSPSPPSDNRFGYRDNRRSNLRSSTPHTPTEYSMRHFRDALRALERDARLAPQLKLLPTLLFRL